MSTGILDGSAGRERLSALADGELERGDVDIACGAWRADADLRRSWHAWHAIGDALRSDDLVTDPRADARFCAAVFARLAIEPVVLAQRRLVEVGEGEGEGGGRSRSRWAYGSAVAAGVMLVAATFVLVRPGQSPSFERLALADGARASSAAALGRSTAAADVSAPDVAVIADQKVIRDAQLDRYLVAHKQFAGISALGVPSVFLRSATVDSASR